MPHGVESVDVRGTSAAWAGASDVWVYDLSDQRQVHKLAAHEYSTHSALFSPDGHTLLSGGADPGGGRIRAWDMANGQSLWSTIGAPEPWGVHLSISPNSNILASEAATLVQVWKVNADGLQSLAKLGRGASPQISSASIVAYWHDDYGIKLATSDGRAIRTIQAKTEHSYFGPLSFSADAAQIAGIGSDGIPRIWNTSDGEVTMSFAKPAESPVALRFSRTSSLLAVVTKRSVMFLDAATGKQVRELHDFVGDVRAIAFSPDDTRIVVGTSDGHISVWGIR
jgi:WD40 repeat protein